MGLKVSKRNIADQWCSSTNFTPYEGFEGFAKPPFVPEAVQNLDSPQIAPSGAISRE